MKAEAQRSRWTFARDIFIQNSQVSSSPCITILQTCLQEQLKITSVVTYPFPMEPTFIQILVCPLVSCDPVWHLRSLSFISKLRKPSYFSQKKKEKNTSDIYVPVSSRWELGHYQTWGPSLAASRIKSQLFYKTNMNVIIFFPLQLNIRDEN